jgi:hypothetical protein
MSSASACKDIPSPDLTKGFPSRENKPLNLVETFREELKIWCKENDKSRDEFCDLINKPYHWPNKVLTGDWNLAAHDLPVICSVLGNRRIIDALVEKYESFDARIQIKLLEDREADLVHEIATLRRDRRRLNNQLKGE